MPVVNSREAVLEESDDVILSGAGIQTDAWQIFGATKATPVSQEPI